MVIPDEGPYVPALPDDAGPFERQLHDIYGFSSGLVELTAEDWGKTADAVTGLALDVKGVVDALRGAQEPWEGPAAEAAYATLAKLRTSLEARSAEITDIKKGLEDAAAAADVARTQYSSQVRSVSTYVDREGYQPEGGGNFNITGYEAAIEARREERESAAKEVLETFNASMGAAAKQMPVESTDDSVTIDTGGNTPSGGGGNGPGGRGPGGGSYTPPNGGVWEPRPPRNDDPPVIIGPPPVDPPTPVIIECGPWPDPDPTDVDLDGETTGTTTPTGPGSPNWAGTGPGGTSGGPGGLGLGTGAGAIGGGALAGGAAMLGKGVLGRLGGGALGAAGRGPLVAGGNTGAPARGSASGRGGAAGAAGRGGMVAGAQSGAAGRGSGGVRGARATGRYGVPKLGEGSRGGRGGVVAAGSGAGSRGGRKGKDGRAEGVDRLTHEDEETWFEGEDDATPPVWR